MREWIRTAAPRCPLWQGSRHGTECHRKPKHPLSPTKRPAVNQMASAQCTRKNPLKQNQIISFLTLTHCHLLIALLKMFTFCNLSTFKKLKNCCSVMVTKPIWYKIQSIKNIWLFYVIQMQPAKPFFTYINYYAVKYDNVVMHWGSYWFASLRLGKALQPEYRHTKLKCNTLKASVLKIILLK